MSQFQVPGLKFQVYPGNYYRTLKSELSRIWSNGNQVLFDIDVKGGVNLKQKFPEQTLSIFVMPPSVEELEKRLRNRSTDDETTIKKRVNKAVFELTFVDKFDIVIINDVLQDAEQKAFKTVSDFISGK